MGKYAEIRNDYYNELERCTLIDAWKSEEDEEGSSIAKVYDDGYVGYLDIDAKTATYAQEVIQETLASIKSLPKINLAHLLTLKSSNRNLWLLLTYNSGSGKAFNCDISEIAVCEDVEFGIRYTTKRLFSF